MTSRLTERIIFVTDEEFNNEALPPCVVLTPAKFLWSDFTKSHKLELVGRAFRLQAMKIQFEHFKQSHWHGQFELFLKLVHFLLLFIAILYLYKDFKQVLDKFSSLPEISKTLIERRFLPENSKLNPWSLED